MSKYVIDNNTLTAIGDAIRTVEESTDIIPVVDIPDRILALGADKPTITLTGDLSYAFVGECFNNELSCFKTKDITNVTSLFNDNFLIEDASVLELNFSPDAENVSLNKMFVECYKLKKLPKIKNNCKVKNFNDIFYYCHNLTTEEATQFLNSLDYSYLEENKETILIPGERNDLTKFFYNCYSLKGVAPAFALKYANHTYTNINNGVNTSIYYYTFYFCVSLDEIRDLPVVPNAYGYTSNITEEMFYNTFIGCYRLKNMTFETNADGTPKVVNWKNQVLDMKSIGYVPNSSNNYITNYNSGITADKEVTDDVSYQALKDDPDWWTRVQDYSRYNHDSAVATINSLPDASAYLAANGGTANKISFRGNAGALTDGGAINTLTEEEIAVAAAKGWTVGLALI